MNDAPADARRTDNAAAQGDAAREGGDTSAGRATFTGNRGRAAVEVGRRLAELARYSQVVVVTHLAQVAAYADAHVVVTKSDRGGTDVVTASGVRTVTGADRVAELARMLSGTDSDTAREHAAELLERSAMGR